MTSLKKILSVLFVVVCFSTFLLSADAQGGFSDEQNAQFQSLIDDLVDQGAVGGTLYVDMPDATFNSSSGLALEGSDEAMPDNPSFRVGPITQTFTTVAMLLLQEDGALDLDSPISMYVPDIAAQFNRGDQITIRHLLSHTSGLASYTRQGRNWRDTFMDSEKLWTPDELITRASSQPINSIARPGTQFYWSNTDSIIAGLIIEEVTGQPAAAVIRERILDPLNMSGTYMEDAEPAIGERIPSHTLLNGTRGPMEYNQTGMWTAGAIVSTAPDMLNFARTVFSGDIFSSEESLEQMLVFNFENRFWEFDYGMGAWVFHGEPMVISAGGSVPGSVSSIGYVPEIDMAYVFLLNSDYLLEDLRFDHFAGDILAILGHDIGELQRAQDDVETEIAPAVDAQYAVGDEITLPAVPVSVNLLDKPGEGGAPFGACFGGGVAIIVQTGNVDNMNWYKVDCTGLQGWLPAEALEQ